MSVKKHTCNICNKDYKSPQSLWNHKNKIHIDIHQKSTNNIHDIDKLSTTNQNKQNINNKEPPKIKKTENTLCNYCNNNFSCYSSLHRHLKTCKKKNNIEKENEELKKEMTEMKQSLEELKKIMLDMINKKCKMHPKKLQKMINSNNTNSNNNITINNNIQYVEYGREDLDKVFRFAKRIEKEKMNILTGMGSKIENLIKYTHLNDKYPQFQNIIITNAKSNQAYAYNQELNRFILCNKNELLEDLIEFRFDDLKLFYEQYKYNLPLKLRETLENTFLSKGDKKCNKLRCKNLNVIFYNQCNKDNIKYKPSEESSNMLDC